MADFGLAKEVHNLSPSNERKSIARKEEEASKEADASVEIPKSPSLLEILHDMSPLQRSDDILQTSFAGSLLWMAPEVFPTCGEKKLHYDNKIDVYSFGIIMWECLALSQPWTHDGTRFETGPINAKIMNAVEAGERPPIRPEQAALAPSGFVDLMKRCWDSDPIARPRFLKILHLLQDMERDASVYASKTEKELKRVSVERARVNSALQAVDVDDEKATKDHSPMHAPASTSEGIELTHTPFFSAGNAGS